MRLGVDFGTTHTVVSTVDRGNYPVVSFESGDALPSLVAVDLKSGALRYGDDAAALATDPGWHVLRSLKRLLHDAGPLTTVEVGGHALRVTDLVAGYLDWLRTALLERSNAGLKKGERLETAISVPANASSAQRFLTLDAFRRAGFDVLAVVNEPSAAAFEYGHKHGRTLSSRREHVAVYDLGGGTFDASLLHMSGRRNDVLASCGVERLGGDDFDAAIARVVAERAGLGTLDALEPTKRTQLLDECRRQKEALNANSRRLVVDLTAFGRPALTLPLDDIWEGCRALVERSMEALEKVLDPQRSGAPVSFDEVAGLYVVGGASSFPLVGRVLRERFGNTRVKRSQHPFASVAIGLAVLLDNDEGWSLADRLGHHFGVWREDSEGRGVWFDAIFAKGTGLPEAGQEREVVRRYAAAHNLGHYRFLECGEVRDGTPVGELLPWSEVRFAFDAQLAKSRELETVPVVRLPNQGPLVEERYRLDAAGLVEVTLALPEMGIEQRYALAREVSPAPATRA